MPWASLKKRGSSFFVPLPEPDKRLVLSVYKLGKAWGEKNGGRKFKVRGLYEARDGELVFGARVWRI